MPDKEEERKNNIVELRAIVDRVKKGGTDPNDLAEAIRINELLGGDFSNVVDLIKKTMDATNELAAKTSPLSPEDLANKPYAAVEAANKFLKLYKVQDTVTTYDKILNGESTEKERLAAINAAAETRKQREKIEAAHDARLAVIRAEIKANREEARRKYNKEINDIYAQRAKINKVAAIDKATMNLQKETGKTLEEIANDDMVKALTGAITKIEKASIQMEKSSYRELTGRDRAPPVKGAKPPVPGHTTEYETAGSSKHPSPTPGMGGNSRQTGKPTETTR